MDRKPRSGTAGLLGDGNLMATFRWNPGVYQALMNGPVMNNLTQRAIRVEAAAKINASGRPGPKVQTGRLRNSIAWVPRPVNATPTGVHGPSVEIGSNLVYSIHVERGHNVVRGGRIVGYAPPYPYLLPALQAARTT